MITAVVSVTYDTNQSSTSQTAHYSKAETSDKQKSTPQVQEKSVSTPSSPTPANNRNNKDRKISLKRINDNYLKKHGLDAHKIKREYLGSRAPISRYDLAYDTKSRIIYIITKTGKIVYKTYYILR